MNISTPTASNAHSAVNPSMITFTALRRSKCIRPSLRFVVSISSRARPLITMVSANSTSPSSISALI